VERAVSKKEQNRQKQFGDNKNGVIRNASNSEPEQLMVSTLFEEIGATHRQNFDKYTSNIFRRGQIG